MKTVKSVDDLKRLALAKGASVSLGSTRFNTTGERARPGPRPAPVARAPEPRPAPPPTQQLDMAPVAQAIERVGELFASALGDLRTHMRAPEAKAPEATPSVAVVLAPAEVAVEPAPRQPRSVTVGRDGKGLIEFLGVDGRRVEVTRDKSGLIKTIGALRVTRNSDGWIETIDVE